MESHWFSFLIATAFAGTGVLGLVAPNMLLGVDQFVAPVRARLTTLEQRTRLQHILLTSYPNGTRTRRIGIVIAVLSFSLAALAIVPFVPPLIVGVAGCAVVVFGVAAACIRLRNDGARRAAALVRRSIPWQLVLAVVLATASTLATGLDPARRSGALLAALAIIVLVVVGTQIALKPFQLRCDDPKLELAIAELVRRGQAWAIASVITTVAMFNIAMGALSGAHAGAASVAGTLLVTAAVIVTSFSVKPVRKLDVVLSELDATPA
jgi:hypothetical protein